MTLVMTLKLLFFYYGRKVEDPASNTNHIQLCLLHCLLSFQSQMMKVVQMLMPLKCGERTETSSTN